MDVGGQLLVVTEHFCLEFVKLVLELLEQVSFFLLILDFLLILFNFGVF